MDSSTASIIISIIGIILTMITVWSGLRKNAHEAAAAQAKAQSEAAADRARTEEQLKELTREVREHNNFAQRMPVVEEQIKVINHRIADLEKEENK